MGSLPAVWFCMDNMCVVEQGGMLYEVVVMYKDRKGRVKRNTVQMRSLMYGKRRWVFFLLFLG